MNFTLISISGILLYSDADSGSLIDNVSDSGCEIDSTACGNSSVVYVNDTLRMNSYSSVINVTSNSNNIHHLNLTAFHNYLDKKSRNVDGKVYLSGSSVGGDAKAIDYGHILFIAGTLLSDANWDQLTEGDMYELMNFLALYEISHSRPVYGELRSECDKLVHCDDSGWLKNLDSDLNKELQSRIFKFFHPDYSFSYILKEPFNTTKDILDFQMFQMDSVKWWFTLYGYEFDNALFKHYYRQFCSEFVLRV